MVLGRLPLQVCQGGFATKGVMVACEIALLDGARLASELHSEPVTIYAHKQITYAEEICKKTTIHNTN